jgi:hypothetical protein
MGEDQTVHASAEAFGHRTDQACPRWGWLRDLECIHLPVHWARRAALYQARPEMDVQSRRNGDSYPNIG